MNLYIALARLENKVISITDDQSRGKCFHLVTSDMDVVNVYQFQLQGLAFSQNKALPV